MCNTDTQPDGTYRLVAAPGPGVVALTTIGVGYPTGQAGLSYPMGQGFDSIKSKNQAGAVTTFLPGQLEPSIYFAAREIDAPAGGVTQGVDFNLDPGATIRVSCTTADGKPAGKIKVLGSIRMKNSIYTMFNDGRFDAVGFGRNETRLVVVRDEEDHLAKIAAVRLADAVNGNITFRLEPAGIVTGRVLDAQGDPIKGGMIQLNAFLPELVRGSSHIGGTYTDETGRFRVEVPAGTRLSLDVSFSRPNDEMLKPVTDNLKLAAGESRNLGDIELSEQDIVK